MRNVCIAILLAAGVPACDQKAPPVTTGPAVKPGARWVAEASVRIPGTSAETVDEEVASKFIQKAVTIPQVHRVACVAQDGLFQGYVEATSSEAGILKRVEAAISSSGLPADADSPVVKLVDRVPVVMPTGVPAIEIPLDGDELPSPGIAFREARAILLTDAAPSEKPPEDGGSTAVISRTHSLVYLRDVSSFACGRRANRIVRKYPPEHSIESDNPPVYRVRVGGAGSTTRPAEPGDLERIAEQTGGMRFSAESLKDLKDLEDLVPGAASRPGKPPVTILIDESASMRVKESDTRPVSP